MAWQRALSPTTVHAGLGRQDRARWRRASEPAPTPSIQPTNLARSVSPGAIEESGYASFGQNEPNPAKWRSAIAKETEPRYPSLRCVLRYWLAMPPPAYPVAVPMPAAPVAHAAAVAMVSMLDALSRCLSLCALQ
jgi:hypothetical protein